MTHSKPTVHHLGRSQSERIVWLCEELEIDYELRRYERRADDRMAPDDYKALHPMGTAPVIIDGDVVLGESGAIVAYLIERYGEGRVTVSSGESGFADHLYWLHFANGTLQPTVFQAWLLERAISADHPLLVAARRRRDRVLAAVDARLAAASYLGGARLTTADVMTVFSLTTMRVFAPYDLSPWPNILAYLERIGARPAYRRAMEKADPDLTPLLGALP